jgi:hypothetical protein
MATRSLSPKRAAERIQRHRVAVRVLALMRAKRIVLAQIRAKGKGSVQHLQRSHVGVCCVQNSDKCTERERRSSLT